MDFIDVTHVDLVAFAKEVYAMSVPVGMGVLHARDGGLSDEDAKAQVDRFKDDKRIALGMEYVHGRCCKMTVYRKDGRLEMRWPWYDHTDGQGNRLLETFGIQVPEKGKHGEACECAECKLNRSEVTKN